MYIEESVPMDTKEGCKVSMDNEELLNYRKEKYIALFQSRTILSKIGTMKEREICKRQLEIMKRSGQKDER